MLQHGTTQVTCIQVSMVSCIKTKLKSTGYLLPVLVITQNFIGKEGILKKHFLSLTSGNFYFYRNLSLNSGIFYCYKGGK